MCWIGFANLCRAAAWASCYLGDGNYNPARVMRELALLGYEGLVMDDHVPFLTGDTRWGHTARAYEIGYIQGMQKMLEYLQAGQ